MTEVRLEHEVHDCGDLLLAEDENAERRSLAAVARQNFLQQALALLGLQLAFDHRMQQPVHDGEERRAFLVRELVFAAELIVHHMEVENQLVDFVDVLAALLANTVQAENLVEHSALIPVCDCLAQVLCLILVQRRIEEEIGNLIVVGRVAD